MFHLEFDYRSLYLQSDFCECEDCRHGAKRVIEDFLDRLAWRIGDESIIVAKKIDAVWRKLMERQKGRRFTVDLEGEGFVGFTPIGPIARIGNFILNLVDTTDETVSSQQEVILLALGTRGALDGEIGLAPRWPLSLIVLGEHKLIQGVDGGRRDGMGDCELVFLIFGSRLATEGYEIVHFVLKLAHGKSFQSGLLHPYSTYAARRVDIGTQVAP